jgi:hypothetical protein
MNIIFHKGKYKLFEPRNKDEQEDNIIDNHLWLVMKYLPKKRHLVTLGDIIRFGRIPFKITKLVLDVEKEKEDIQKQYDKED